MSDEQQIPDPQLSPIDEATPPSPTSQIPSPDPQAEEYLAGWKRALADYENAKKETARARQDGSLWAKIDVLTDLLPSLDAFDAALKYAPDLSALDATARTSVERWIAGVKQVQGLLTALMEQQGATRIPTDGLLDPHRHESVGERESDQPPGTIIEVVAQGYMLGERLLRPARVIVSSGSTVSDAAQVLTNSNT